MKQVILGSVTDDLEVQTVKGNAEHGHTHDVYGLDGEHNFRVVDNKIFWWFHIPGEKVKDAVNEKLDKFGVPSPRKNLLLSFHSTKYETYMERFVESHGYEG